MLGLGDKIESGKFLEKLAGSVPGGVALPKGSMGLGDLTWFNPAVSSPIAVTETPETDRFTPLQQRLYEPNYHSASTSYLLKDDTPQAQYHALQQALENAQFIPNHAEQTHIENRLKQQQRALIQQNGPTLPQQAMQRSTWAHPDFPAMTLYYQTHPDALRQIAASAV